MPAKVAKDDDRPPETEGGRLRVVLALALAVDLLDPSPSRGVRRGRAVVVDLAVVAEQVTRNQYRRIPGDPTREQTGAWLAVLADPLDHGAAGPQNRPLGVSRLELREVVGLDDERRSHACQLQRAWGADYVKARQWLRQNRVSQRWLRNTFL